MGAGLLAIFGLLAMLLAAVGVYGVISNAVDQRAHEMGIRMALGSARSGVVRLILRQGLVLVVAGVIAGLIAAGALSRMVGGMLFDVSPADPLTYAVVASGLVAVAMFATWIPALRLTRIDPVTALRDG